MDSGNSAKPLNKNSPALRPILTIGTQNIIVIDQKIVKKLNPSSLFRQELREDGTIVLTPSILKGSSQLSNTQSAISSKEYTSTV